MKKKLSRRKFLKAGLSSTLVVSGGAAAGFVPTRLRAAGQAEKPVSPGFGRHARAVLRAAMDEIIPGSGSMPAASEVGGVEYLDKLAREAPEIKKDLEKSLAALDELSTKHFGKDFPSLSRADRVEALKKLEKQAPQEIFAGLRDYVYEAYYTRPQVWKLIGYEFHPTNQAGPNMKPFDESVLAEVRKKPKLYREVP